MKVFETNQARAKLFGQQMEATLSHVRAKMRQSSSGARMPIVLQKVALKNNGKKAKAVLLLRRMP